MSGVQGMPGTERREQRNPYEEAARAAYMSEADRQPQPAQSPYAGAADQPAQSPYADMAAQAERPPYPQMSVQPGYAGTSQEAQAAVTRGRKHFSKLGLMFFLGAIIVNAVELGFLLLFEAIRPEWTQNMTGRLLIMMVPMYVIALPLMALLIRQVPVSSRQPAQKHRMNAGQLSLAFIMCYSVMYISNLIGNFITVFIGILKGSAVNNAAETVAGASSLWFNLIIVVLIAPVFEEFIFRKLLVDRTAQYGEGTAILLSGLLFGLFHGNLNQFIYAFTLGMCFAFIYVKTREVKYTVILHMVINFLGSVATVLLLRAVDVNGFYKRMGRYPYDSSQYLSFFLDMLPQLMILGTYVVLLLAVVVTGIVLWCVFGKRIRFAKGELRLPKGRRFTTVFLNVGMGLYIVFWLIVIIVQLLL